MSDARLDVIVIGNLARNKYWGEKRPVREEYATATLVRSGETVLLVDPGWPGKVLQRALFYRAGLEPGAVTHVFLTHFDPKHLWGLALFPEAVWWMQEEEIRYVEAEREEAIAALPRRFEAVPENLAEGVDLFPTPGPAPGHASLLVLSPTTTSVVAGDIVLTQDHFERGDLGEAPWDLEKAHASFRDVAEIADVIVPGHDNVFLSRSGTGML